MREEEKVNPKDSVGVKKTPFSVVPMPVLWEVGVGLLEGARKYGRHNWRRKDVRASVYFDGTMRHLTSWWEGENIDADSGLNHISKAITSLIVFRDAMLQDCWKDDRPPKTAIQISSFNKMADQVIQFYPEPEEPELEKKIE